MAISCFLTLNGEVIYPELPIGREWVIVSEDKRMLNGQLRRAYRAFKRRFTFTLIDATEAQYTDWIGAALGGVAASVTYTDEQGVSRSVFVISATEDLSRTTPAVEDGASTTGPGYYDLQIVVEEI
jgi:hypothetical protein